MKYADITPTMRRFLGAFEAFRKLGYPSDSLFCLVSGSVALDGGLACFAVLKAQGKEFNLECGPVEDGKEFIEEYMRVTKALNAREIPQEDLDRIWQESEPFEKKVQFTAALLFKGFVSPKRLS